MPIILDDSVLTEQASDGKLGIDATDASIATLGDKVELTPRYFSKELNGNGRTAKGRISSSLTPANPDLSFTPDLDTIVRKHTIKNDKITIHNIPLSPVLARAECRIARSFHDTGRTTNVDPDIPGAGSIIRQLDPVSVEGAYLMIHPQDNADGVGTWLTISPHVAVIRSEESVDVDGKKSNDHTTHIAYRVAIIHAGADHYDLDVDTGEVTLTATKAVTYLDYPHAAITTARAGHVSAELDYTYDVTTAVLSKYPHTDEDELKSWLEAYDLYDHICRMATVVSSDDAVADVIEILDAYLEALPAPNPAYDQSDAHVIGALALQMNFLESYNLSLEGYRRIYTVLNKYSAAHPHLIKQLVAQNMQLALNDNLHTLSGITDQLPVAVENPANPYPMPPHYSGQQQAAITAAEPLTIIASGAGTGKSTVILERIRYIEHCGHHPATTTVLSFTNAAADNITEKNPGVRSRTFAAQLNEIYAYNFPDHQLSNLDTIVNSIDIYYVDELRRQEPVVTSFRRLLRDVAKPNSESRPALTKLNNFVEHHLQDCLNILNRVKQVSLELQNIICYQLIDQLAEPFTPPQFVIVDEVQDTSIFEFVYILRYITKHRANLYIVGDASQTLYEFRAANPKALNSLEASGIFGVHRLTTNYRSNQEILDFANIHLQNIDANQYAKIQLNANNLRQVTSTSLQEKIQVKHFTVNNVRSLADELPGAIMAGDTASYIDGCLARNEKVAFLTGTRREAMRIEETVKQMYPDKTVLSLVSERMYNNSLFSKYVNQYWGEVTAVAPADAPFVFTTQVAAHLSKLEPTSSPKQAAAKAASAQRTLSQWWLDNNNVVTGLIQAYNNNALSRDDFFINLRDNILDYEIRINNTKQTLVSERNRQRKEEAGGNADMFVSTIHGVKGLEFDNVVLVHKPVDDENEADKRLYYVALTRAKNTEFIIAVGKRTLPRLITDYETLVKKLSDNEEEAIANAALDLNANVNVTTTATAAASGTDSTMSDPIVDQTVIDAGNQDDDQTVNQADTQVNTQTDTQAVTETVTQTDATTVDQTDNQIGNETVAQAVDQADTEDNNTTVTQPENTADTTEDTEEDTLTQYSTGPVDAPNPAFAHALAHLLPVLDDDQDNENDTGLN